ncbi:hypothetical protein BU14_0218s0038 [Porphyra umbilicalis]|uniref:Zinc finger LSD1-type domain-containing protein n=1 Tax=Porphyra umbilicalis TaxID=2786 RepID=A0A1X6P5F4_PORUM|nr:hypothetical protein BU14_0218s0038 [Porphyra umbilicalis]|eukprot:OSX75873.1 hypothetical protein BU14_0218s0038 [Porphyra umbilicalis]
MIPSGDHGGPSQPPYSFGTETLQSVINCSACGQSVTFPRGAAMVRCPTCGDVLVIRRTDNGQDTGGQGVCCGCRMILLYQMGVRLVSCSFCGSVTLLPPLESFQCRGCKMTLNYAPGPASLVRCVVCHEMQEVQPVQQPASQPMPLPPPQPQQPPPLPPGRSPHQDGGHGDSPPESTPSPSSMAPPHTPAAASASSPMPLQFPMSPEPSMPPAPLPSGAGSAYGARRPFVPGGSVQEPYRGMPSTAAAGTTYGHSAAAAGPPLGPFGGSGLVGMHQGAPPYAGPPPPMRSPLPGPFLPQLPPGLPGGHRLPLPSFPVPQGLAAYPPISPMYAPGAYGAYGGPPGGPAYWQPPPLPFPPPPPLPGGRGDWRGLATGAFHGAPGLGHRAPPSMASAGGPVDAVGAAGFGAPAPTGVPPAAAGELEDGDLPSSAAALQREMEDLQLGRGAPTGAAADPGQADQHASSPSDAAVGIDGGHTTGTEPPAAAIGDRQHRDGIAAEESRGPQGEEASGARGTVSAMSSGSVPPTRSALPAAEAAATSSGSVGRAGAASTPPRAPDASSSLAASVGPGTSGTPPVGRRPGSVGSNGHEAAAARSSRPAHGLPVEADHPTTKGLSPPSPSSASLPSSSRP